MVKEMTAVVAAAAPNRGIGYQGQMPWRLPGDMEHFKRVTMDVPPNSDNEYPTTNAVVMGRKTWESIPVQFRPLPGRINVVLSRQSKETLKDTFPEGVVLASSLSDAAVQLQQMQCQGQVFVIGGEQIYQQALDTEGLVNCIIYTEIDNLPPPTKFDAFFPELSPDVWDVQPYSIPEKGTTTGNDVNECDKENHSTELSQQHIDPKSGIRYRFLKYTRKQQPTQPTTSSEGNVVDKTKETAMNVEEEQYLNLCREILATGIQRGDRTGTGTLSKFGTQMRFSLRNGTLPLLTTKRTFWRGVAEELLWFIQGNTNANDLAAKEIHIWDGNGSREFLDGRGLQHREVGDLGPVYGFQWRHFGATYVDMHTDYTGQGVDQLADCIDKIIHHPEDRRIIMSAWNPADLDEMALPPCHMFCQFYVDVEKNELSCQMYQRSADMGLGVPFNIASYALLTHLVAQVTGRQPGDFIHTIGDAHIYLNHVDALQEQLERHPRPFPKLRINPNKKHIDDFEFSDFEVIGYDPHKPIKMKMAV